MSSHDETRRYVTRREDEGLNTAEIMRCLKHYVAPFDPDNSETLAIWWGWWG